MSNPNTAIDATTDANATLLKQEVTIAIVTAVVVGIIIWDYLSLLPNEIALYRSQDKKTWRTPTTWFFVILRYSGLLAMIPSLFFSSVQTNHCVAAVVLTQVGAILAVASSGIIFCYRVFAIWSNNRRIVIVVLLAYTFMLVCWIAVATQNKAITGPATPVFSNCLLFPVVPWAPLNLAASVAFDTLVLVLSLTKLSGTLAASSRVGRQIYQGNLMYFVIVTVTNIIVLIFQALGQSGTFLKPLALPFNTLMTVTMGSRVYLNLKLMDRKRAREDGPVNAILLSDSTASGSQNTTPNVHVSTNTIRAVSDPFGGHYKAYGENASFVA
ncbi:hypothetical protein DFH11DRAFT_448323 [Phellopilus nigrolimitatus]|nr:hypothetical protein DFH11DRAFT_448323 [Phellopilus nigrolimitatus]